MAKSLVMTVQLKPGEKGVHLLHCSIQGRNDGPITTFSHCLLLAFLGHHGINLFLTFYRNIQSKGACLAAGILSSKQGEGTGGLLCIFTHLIHLFLVLCLTEFLNSVFLS